MDEISVTGPSGEPYEYWDSRERHYRKLKIRVPGASDAVRTGKQGDRDRPAAGERPGPANSLMEQGGTAHPKMR